MIILGIFLALLSALSYAINNIANKKISQNLNEYESLLLVSFFLLFIAATPNYLFGSFILSLNVEVISFILLGSLIGFVGLLYLFKSFKYLSVGIILTLANTFPLVTLLLTTLYHKTYFTLLYFVPLLIIFYGVYYLHFSSKNINSKFIYMPLITSLSWGFFSFASYTLLENNISPYTITFYLELLIFIYALVFSLIKNKIKYTKSKISKNFSLAILSAIFLTLASISLNFSFKYIHPAVASSIVTSDIIFGILLSYLIFKEKLTKKELISITIIIIGILCYLFI